MIPSYWQDALAYLTRTDEVMAGLIASYPDAVLKNQGNPFHTLTRAVVGQQISIKAADAVWQRLEAQLETISPPQLLTVGEDALRQCGLSRQKISYLSAIACAFEEGTLTPSQWERMSDCEVASQLMGIRGIGQWTAEMFLIFHLNRPDVLPLTDLGLTLSFLALLVIPDLKLSDRGLFDAQNFQFVSLFVDKDSTFEAPYKA